MPSDPLFVNAVDGAPAYDASELRRALGVMLIKGGVSDRFGARSGVHPAGANVVTLAGDTVTIANFQAIVYPGHSSSAGAYMVQLSQHTRSVPVAAANPRKDVIVLRVWDSDEDGTGEKKADTEYIAGTPASSPSEPAVPAGAVRLATIDVPALGGGGPTLTYNAPFVVASGGVLPVRVAGDLPTAGVYESMYADRRDSDTLYRWSGSGWEAVASPASYAAALAPIALGYAGTSDTVSSITSTTYEAGTSFGATFVQPANSTVAMITWGGLVRIVSAADDTIYLAAQIRQGDVIGSGTIVTSASDASALRYRKPTTPASSSGEMVASHFFRASALTPGDTYNVQLLHRVSGGTGTVSNRRLSIQRWS